MINSDVAKSIVPNYLNILNKLGHLTIGKESTIRGITILPSGSTLALVRIDNGSERVDVPLESLLANIASIGSEHPDYKFVGLVLHDIEKSILEVRSQVASCDPKAGKKEPSRLGVILTYLSRFDLAKPSLAAKVYSKFNKPAKAPIKAQPLTMDHEVAQVSIASSTNRPQLAKIAGVFKRTSILMDKQAKRIAELEAKVEELEQAAQSGGLLASIKQSALSALSAIRSRL
jgi:hypothetical protein